MLAAGVLPRCGPEEGDVAATGGGALVDAPRHLHNLWTQVWTVVSFLGRVSAPGTTP